MQNQEETNLFEWANFPLDIVMMPKKKIQTNDDDDVWDE